MKVYSDRMTIALKIKEIADASGFSTATLRYYEQIGLLPESTRTPAGYRVYDHRTLDRLAFIARAKQLGCTLDEIAGLTTAWDGGRCGPIQDRLRQLVSSKVAAAQIQIGDLMTFTSELEAAAAALEQHRPRGACDETCGCLRGAAPASEPPVVCTLAAGSMKGRIADWQALLTHVAHRERIDGGLRVVFAPDPPVTELMRLVAAEQDCCQFFQFAITVDNRGIALEVRASADALSIVTSMFGSPS